MADSELIQQLGQKLEWIVKIVDSELVSDDKLRSRAARTLRRVGDAAEDALKMIARGEVHQ